MLQVQKEAVILVIISIIALHIIKSAVKAKLCNAMVCLHCILHDSHCPKMLQEKTIGNKYHCPLT